MCAAKSQRYDGMLLASHTGSFTDHRSSTTNGPKDVAEAVETTVFFLPTQKNNG